VRAFIALFITTFALFSGRSAIAAEEPPRHDETRKDWHGAIGAGTDFPLSVGLRGQIDAPTRLRLSSSIGIAPRAYLGAINGVVVATGAVDPRAADLVTASVDRSLVWRTHLGYRPFERAGFTIEAGYGHVSFGGQAPASDVYAAGTGQTAPPEMIAGVKSFNVDTTLHMLDLEVGWDFAVVERLLLRASIGGAFTIASSTTIDPTTTPSLAGVVAPYTNAAASQLDHAYRSYGFTPVLGLSGSFLVF
jgi:hypothetical protein